MYHESQAVDETILIMVGMTLLVLFRGGVPMLTKLNRCRVLSQAAFARNSHVWSETCELFGFNRPKARNITDCMLPIFYYIQICIIIHR